MGMRTLTMLGGSRIPPEVLEAMASAAQHFVDIDELQAKVGNKIAAWTKNEAAYISCGAAAGLVLSTAACITGMDPEKRARLPFTEGMKNEVILHRCGRVGYEFSIRQAGGRLVEIGGDEKARPRRSWKERSGRIRPRLSFFIRMIRWKGRSPWKSRYRLPGGTTSP